MATKQKKGSLKKGTVPPPVAKTISLKHKFNGEIIHVISDEFPVRKGSRRAEIFALFQDGMNLSDFLIAARKIRGGATDVQIALDKNFIELK